MSYNFFQIGSVTIMGWTGENRSFAVETFFKTGECINVSKKVPRNSNEAEFSIRNNIIPS